MTFLHFTLPIERTTLGGLVLHSTCVGTYMSACERLKRAPSISGKDIMIVVIVLSLKMYLQSGPIREKVVLAIAEQSARLHDCGKTAKSCTRYSLHHVQCAS